MFSSLRACREKVGKEEVLLGKATEEMKQLSVLRKFCHSHLTLQAEPTSPGNTWVIHHLPSLRVIKCPELEGTHKECQVQLLALHRTLKIPTTSLRAFSRLSLNSSRLGGLGVVCSSQPQSCATFAGTLQACLIFHPNLADKNNKAALTFHINCLLYYFHGYLYFSSHLSCSLGDDRSGGRTLPAPPCTAWPSAAVTDFFFLHSKSLWW